MSPLVRYILNALLAAVVGGSIPATTGLSGWELYVAVGVSSAVFAVWNLWQHKPGMEPTK